LEKGSSLNAKFGIVIMGVLIREEMSLYSHSHHPIGLVFVGCGYIRWTGGRTIMLLIPVNQCPYIVVMEVQFI
jgi:hypothetical protein